MKKERYEFFVLTAAGFLEGALLFGALSIALTYSGTPVWGMKNPFTAFLFAALGGGYFFFSLLSGLLFTANWLAKKRLKHKLIFLIFFCVPIWMTMAGIYYSIPYGIYNFIQYRRLKNNPTVL